MNWKLRDSTHFYFRFAANDGATEILSVYTGVMSFYDPVGLLLRPETVEKEGAAILAPPPGPDRPLVLSSTRRTPSLRKRRVQDVGRRRLGQ